MTPQQKKRKGSHEPPRGGLVQFRADDELMAELSQVADRLNLPVGVLARFWVSERLRSELSFDIATIEAWREERYKIIDRVIEEDFNPGPILVLHLVPFQRLLEIEPERIRQFQGMLAPVERVDDFFGRINIDGYQTIKQFRSEDKIAGCVQVFRTGQLESIRRIQKDEQGCIYGNQLDNDLIRAVWSYSCALEALGVKTPVALFVGFKRVAGCRVKYPRLESPSTQINANEFRLQGVSIKSWDDVLKIENAAETVKKFLDRFANAAGLARSLSYSANGDWFGPSDGPDKYVRRTKMATQIGTIELSGTNREANRVDLVLHDRSEELVVGKVNAPYLEPTESTTFKCLVNQDEMAPGAKQRLEEKEDLKQPASFSVGNIRFTGRVTRITPGFGAGSFDGINIPQERVLMFEVEPFPRTQTPGQCASCKRILMPGEGRFTPYRGTLCLRCFEG